MTTDAGNSVFLRDIKKFPEDALVSLVAVMERHRKGTSTPDEVDTWGEGMLELKKRVDGCWYRVIFVVRDTKLVAVAAFTKKTNKTSPNDSKTAKNRKPSAGSDLVRVDLMKILDDA